MLCNGNKLLIFLARLEPLKKDSSAKTVTSIALGYMDALSKICKIYILYFN